MRKPQEWFESQGCSLAHPKVEAWPKIYRQSLGDPCKNCALNFQCSIYAEYKQTESETPATPSTSTTNAEAATILGISKRQVAKLRRNGELDDALANAKA